MDIVENNLFSYSYIFITGDYFVILYHRFLIDSFFLPKKGMGQISNAFIQSISVSKASLLSFIVGHTTTTFS